MFLSVGSVRFEDLLDITRKMKELDLNIGMLSAVPYGLLPDYYKQLGKDAEFVYSGSFGTPPSLPWKSGVRRRVRKRVRITSRRSNRQRTMPAASS